MTKMKTQKSNMSKSFAAKGKLRGYAMGGRVRGYADGGDIISRGNQRIDDAIAAMEQGNAPAAPAPDMRSTLEQHPVNPSIAGGFPTDKTPMLDQAFETAISLGLRAGGPVRGPGGPTSDKIPAMLSNGEYVLPADTVQAVGKKNLDKLRAKTHTPVAAQTGYANGGSYTGDVFDQFNQALGDAPRTLQSNPADERLHAAFDDSLGFRNDTLARRAVDPARRANFMTNGSAAGNALTAGAGDALAGMPSAFRPAAELGADAAAAQQQNALTQAASSAAGGLRRMLGLADGGSIYDHYDRTFQYADGGLIPYPRTWAGQQSPARDEQAYPQAPAGSSRLRFMSNGGGIPYPEEWTGDPKIRFLANGGYPSADGLTVEEIPDITLRSQPGVQYPGPEGIHVSEIPNSASADLDSSIGARARAAKAARAGTPIMDAVSDAGSTVAQGARTAGSAVAQGASRLRQAAAGLPGRIASGARSLGMSAAAPIAAFEGIKSGIEGLQTPTEEYAKNLGFGRAGDSLLGDMGIRAAGVMQGFGNNLLGLVGMRQDGKGGATTPPVSVSGQGGGASGGGNTPTPQGTAIINGRTVSPAEIQALNNRNVIPAGTSPFPLPGGEAGPGAGFDRTDRTDQSGGVFHMPQRDVSGEINDRFDALAKKIGPIGRSAARLRALQGLEGERASALTSLAGQGSQERVANAGLQATIAQRQWDRNLDAAKFGIEQGRLNRQLQHDQAVFGLDQAKYLDGVRTDVMGKQIPDILKGMQGYSVDDKGNLDSKSQAKGSNVMRRLQASIPDLARVPKSALPDLVKIADDARNDDEAQQGLSGYIRRALIGGTGGTSDQIASHMPNGNIQRGALYDTDTDALGNKHITNERLRGGLFPLGPVDMDRAKTYYGQ